MFNLIYNSSDEKIEFPSVHKDKYTKDFSWGFYCLSSYVQAQKSNNKIINVYSLKDVKSLNIKVFPEYNNEWLDFVMKCRSGNIHGYDLVMGCIADDTIYDYMEDYNKNEMDKERFFNEMKSKHKGYQISFHTVKALDCMNFIESCEVQ